MSWSRGTGGMPDLRALRESLHSELYGRVVPFWLRHAIDPDGGINNCLADDATLVSRDRWLWSQWRAVWVFSRLYRQTGDKQFIQIADGIRQFCCRHGWHADGGWRLCVSAAGDEIRGRDSIYVDGFAMYGLAEFIAATDDEDAKRWARRTTSHVVDTLGVPHDQIPHFPYPVPRGMRVHGIPMIFSLCFQTMADTMRDDGLAEIARRLSHEVMHSFYRQDRDVVLERINADGTEAQRPLGTVVVPGHVIESMWFQIDVASATGDTPTIDRAIALIRRHLELGWDDPYGGLLLAVDADGGTEVGWSFADTKLWWPHTEAMIALLRAYEISRAPWCLDWYERIHSYTFKHFPDSSTGEWLQRLDRTGRPISEIVALPVKDPFHLPRALMLCIEILDRIEKDLSQTVGNIA